jgi:hypothetical protein
VRHVRSRKTRERSVEMMGRWHWVVEEREKSLKIMTLQFSFLPQRSDGANHEVQLHHQEPQIATSHDELLSVVLGSTGIGERTSGERTSEDLSGTDSAAGFRLNPDWG